MDNTATEILLQDIGMIYQAEGGNVVMVLTSVSLDIQKDEFIPLLDFFPVALNMLSGLKAVRQDNKNFLLSYVARKPLVYLKLMLPSCLSALFSGLKIVAPMSVAAAILVDMFSTKDDIGAVMGN